MINSKKNLGMALYIKWKAMGDTDNQHRIASKIEGKMNEMITKSLSAGLKPLE